MKKSSTYKLLTGTLVGAVAVSSLAMTPASASTATKISPRAAGKAVSPLLFGMHVLNISGQVNNTGAAALRLWDAGVSWRDIQPTDGPINWAPLDSAVANAQASGVTDIQYVLGNTPLWAARNTSTPPGRAAGSASYPKNDSDYLNFAGAVAGRYAGRITSFQVWNEADLPDFYNGTAAQLASLTKKANAVIKAASPSAMVGAAGLVPRPSRFGKGSFEDQYFKGLKKLKWPVNAFVFSMYPENQNPNRRAKYIAIAKAALKRNKAPARQIWESEANYFSTSGEFAAGAMPRLVARTYLDSPGLGIARVYWYAWEQHLPMLGVWMTSTNGVPTTAATAYRTVKGWMNGKRMSSCKNQGGVMRCNTTGGIPASIVYRMSGSKTIKAPKGSTQICRLNGSCAGTSAGAKISVGTEPIQILLG